MNEKEYAKECLEEAMEEGSKDSPDFISWCGRSSCWIVEYLLSMTKDRKTELSRSCDYPELSYCKLTLEPKKDVTKCQGRCLEEKEKEDYIYCTACGHSEILQWDENDIANVSLKCPRCNSEIREYRRRIKQE